MKKHLFLIAALLTSIALPAFAAEPKAHLLKAHYSAEDQEDLTRVEDYLNGLKTMSADFVQLDDGGGVLRGKILIARPGKMRVTYDNKDFIIADGSMVHIWSEDLKSQTNVDQGTSLAEFILRDPVKLDGDVSVTNFVHRPAKMEVTLVQTKDPGAGSLTLVFEDKPLKLHQWKVVDAQGRSTGVTLENISERASFPESTFVYVSPTFGNKHQ